MLRTCLIHQDKMVSTQSVIVFIALFTFCIGQLSQSFKLASKLHLNSIRDLNDYTIKQTATSEISSLSNSIHRKLPDDLKDEVHGVKMGTPSDMCDNAKDYLSVDWDSSPVNYTCYHPKNPYPVLDDYSPLETCDTIPEDYVPKHICMDREIHYARKIPTYGNHRPLWPVYGEYTFVPPQRWLHSLEHGAIVMLYHPCAEPLEIERLRLLVQNCIRRHVITAYIHLPKERPLALVAWGCKLLMNNVDEYTVIKFIKERSLHGPEGHLAKEGQYHYKLLQRSVIPIGSTITDSVLCPSSYTANQWL